MAYQEIILPEIEYMGRRIRTYLHIDSTTSVTTPTKVSIVNIGDMVERIDVIAGKIEVENVEVRAVDNYDNETEGFWHKAFSGTEQPQMWITIEEPAGNYAYCIGNIMFNTVQYHDTYLSANELIYTRNVTFTIADVLTTLKNVSVAAVAAEAKSHTVVDNLFGLKPFVTSFDYSGAGSYNVGYRIAACTSNDEDIWGDEIKTSTAPNSWGTVTLHWTAIVGADHYNIYRTTDELTGSTGKIGTAPALSTPSYVDTGTVAYKSTQKTREYVCINDIFASFVVVAFGETFDRTLAIMTENINNLRYSSATVTSVNAKALYVTTDSMTDGNELYWGDRYKDAWDLFFALAKGFALIPRHVYDMSVVPNVHHFEFIARENAYATEITFSKGTKESDHSCDTLAKISSIETHRANGKNKYIVGYPVDADSYELSIPCEYVAGKYDGVAQTMGSAIVFGGYTIPKLYVTSTTGFTSGKAYVAYGENFEEIKYTDIGVDGTQPYLKSVTAKNTFTSNGNVYPADPEVLRGETLFCYNGTGIEDITSASFWNAQTGALVGQTNGALHLASLRDYFRYRLGTKKQLYKKTYGTMSAIEDGAESHKNVRVGKRTTIYNGASSLKHYASEIKKSIETNTCSIEWCQE